MTDDYYAYGFKMTARIRALFLRMKGHSTTIRRGWVDKDGNYIKLYDIFNSDKPQEDALLAYIVRLV